MTTFVNILTLPLDFSFIEDVQFYILFLYQSLYYLYSNERKLDSMIEFLPDSVSFLFKPSLFIKCVIFLSDMLLLHCL